MNNYKPYSYLYKDESSNPKKLKSCFVVYVPAYKKVVITAGGPITSNGKTIIKYNIEDDASVTRDRQEEFENEFNWDGLSHEVEVKVGDGSGSTGGETVLGSNDAETF